MKLFHGSLVRVEYPDVTIGRDSLDFGRGFYMTRDYEQAVRWTNILVKRDHLESEQSIHLNSQMMRLKNEKIRNQLCIVKQDVVNECLKYVESVIIE